MRGRWPFLDALAAVIARVTPLLMVGLIGLAGVGLLPGVAADPAAGLEAVAAAVGVRLANEPVARWLRRPRPFEHGFDPALVWHDAGNGFPSNHAAGAFALAVCVAPVPGYGPILLILAGLLAASRVYSGVHYLTDVIAGALHGILVAFLVRWLAVLLFHV